MALLQKVDSADGSSVFDHLAQVVLKVRRLQQAAHICMQHACMQGTTRSNRWVLPPDPGGAAQQCSGPAGDVSVDQEDRASHGERRHRGRSSGMQPLRSIQC